MRTGWTTLSDRLADRCNNFDFVRLFAAWLVLFSHCYFLYQPPMDGPYYEPFRKVSGVDTLGTLAVRVFFIISGLLVARSYLSDPAPWSYLKKRGLRIFPGLVVCTAFCVLVIGPMVTSLPLREYFAHADTWKFFNNAHLYPLRYELPGVFENNPQIAVNGSLWSLPLEFLMYIAVLTFGLAGLLRWGFILAGLAAALFVHATFKDRMNFDSLPGVANYWLPKIIEFGYFFFAGTAILLLKRWVVLDWRIFAMAVVAVVASFRTPVALVIYSLALPYIVMYLSFVRLPWVASAARWGDFSYGTYLYAFPMQQVVLHYGLPRGISFSMLVIISTLLTLPLAIASWHLVEKPFMRLKKRTSDHHVPSKACAVPQAAPAEAASNAAPLAVS